MRLIVYKLKETWKEIDMAEFGYMVSNKARVKNRFGKIQKSFPNKHGYLMFKINVGLNRAVATAFVDNPDDKKEVTFIKNKISYLPDNLKWIDSMDRIPKGEENGHSKFKDADIPKIVAEFYELGISQVAFGEKYGVAGSTISRMINGVSYKHLKAYIK